MSKFDPATIEALADAWASLDGKLDEFRAGKLSDDIEAHGGHYAGYLADAEEMLKRLLERRFVLMPIGLLC